MIQIDDQIKTREGFVYIVVDLAPEAYGISYAIVRVDPNGNDMAMREGEEGVDWEYVHIPLAECERV